MHTLSRYFLPCALLLVVLVAGCDSTDESGIAMFNGRVADADGVAIAGATVFASDFGISTQTDGQGEFALSVEVDSSRQSVTLDIFADGYEETTRTVQAFVDQDTRVPEIVLQRRGGNGGGGGGDGDGDGGGVDDGADEPSGPAASITLLQRSSESIGVQSAGADETSTLTFVVLDAFGNPIDTEHAVEVTFSIGNGPGGGEFLAPTVKETNAAGRVQTTVSSGTVAGTVQIFATATNEEGTTIRSLPVIITITGGLPDQTHFSVAPEQLNVAGYDVLGVITPVTALVGDIYANPVQPGTAVYFTSTSGVIEGSGTTNALGLTTVSWVSGNPRTAGTPPAACPDSDPNGYSNITATTSDLNQETITATTLALLSGISEIEFTDVDADPDNGDLGNYGFRVSDRFGHPLAPGTTIEVTADGVNVEAVGDDRVELDDYLCPAPGVTDFLISVVQGDEIGEDDLPLPPQLETLTIRVTSPNGNAQLTTYNTGGRMEVVFERF